MWKLTIWAFTENNVEASAKYEITSLVVKRPAYRLMTNLNLSCQFCWAFHDVPTVPSSSSSPTLNTESCSPDRPLIMLTDVHPSVNVGGKWILSKYATGTSIQPTCSSVWDRVPAVVFHDWKKFVHFSLILSLKCIIPVVCIWTNKWVCSQ